MASASSSPVEQSRAGEMLPRTRLFDLSNDILISIFQALDIESLIKMACTAKRFLQFVQQDSLWMELCRPWADLVELPSWRARMSTGVDLYRLLRSFSNLSGLWMHKNCNPQRELLHVIWGSSSSLFHYSRFSFETNCRNVAKAFFSSIGLSYSASYKKLQGSGELEGPQVIPASSDDHIKFVKLFDVTGEPIGSDSVEAVFTAGNRPDSRRLSGRLILPTASQNQFVLESHNKSGVGLTGNSSRIRLGVPGGSLSLPSNQGSEGEVWRKLFKKLKIGVPALGQELRGLWTGLNGPHGWEIVAITYSEDGFILGTKVTGDPNVPSGEATFKGRIDMSVDFSTSNFLRGFPLPNQCFWFTKMYRGEGRIAQENFSNPTWVSGVLLQESSGLITFVWEFNNYRIRYRRLNLESLFRNRLIADASRAI